MGATNILGVLDDIFFVVLSSRHAGELCAVARILASLRKHGKFTKTEEKRFACLLAMLQDKANELPG